MNIADQLPLIGNQPAGKGSPTLLRFWRPAWRLLLLVVVLSVVLMTARQVPSGGSGSRGVPPPASALDAGRGFGTVAAPREAPRELDHANRYVWLSRKGRAQYAPLRERIPAPDGFTRVEVEPGIFADWLRHLPVGPADRPVTNHRRQVVLPAGDPHVAAVIDLQPGAGNLLTGPAMMLRLRAEYAWASAQLSNLAFHYTSGHVASWPDWAAGQRPVVRGKMVQFEQSRTADDSRESFCGYLETLFRYTTVNSLLADLCPSKEGTIAAGDVFVLTGRAGHAVVVLDVATGVKGEVRVLLGQGGNPAVTFHVPREQDGSPWFAVSKSGGIRVGGKDWLKLKDLRHWKL